VRQLLARFPSMPATVIAERVGWPGSASWFRKKVAALRVEYVPKDPAGRLGYRPGDQAQCDLWFPPVRVPLGAGQCGSPPVLVMVATLLAWVPPLTGHLGTGQLRPGDCLTGSLGLGSGSWPYMVATAPCTGPHLGEVFFAGNDWPKSLTAYPGDKALSDQGWSRCLTAFTAYDGLDNSSSELSIYYIIPYDWSNGDRWLVCIAYEPTDQYPGGMPVNQSIRASNL